MTYNSLTENNEHNIPSQILKTSFGLRLSFFKTPTCVVSSTFVGFSDPKPLPNSSGQQADLIIYIIPPE